MSILASLVIIGALIIAIAVAVVRAEQRPEVNAAPPEFPKIGAECRENGHRWSPANVTGNLHVRCINPDCEAVQEVGA